MNYQTKSVQVPQRIVVFLPLTDAEALMFSLRWCNDQFKPVNCWASSPAWFLLVWLARPSHYKPRSPFPVLIYCDWDYVIRLDGLASQTSFQQMAVSPKCNVVLLGTLSFMLCSPEEVAALGKWLPSAYVRICGDHWPELCHCSTLLTYTYVAIISQCPHPGVYDVCHMGEGGM